MPEKILRLLKQEESFVSGALISKELRITRSAVWKKIKALREQGFHIEAVPSKGYRLIKSPDLSKDEVSAHVCGNFWRKVLFYESVDSTNELAASLSLNNEVESGVVIIADRQRRGKGRLDRRWFSPKGVNVYMSFILKPELEPNEAVFMTMAAAVACATALEKTSGQVVSIKWPNDLISSGKKIGGILTEVRSEPDKIKTAVIGIGVNVNSKTRKFPYGLREIATSLKQMTGLNYSRSRIIISILDEFESCYTDLQQYGKEGLLKAYRQLSSTIGTEVNVTVGRETISGYAEDVDDAGLLVLRLPSGDVRKFSTGDISLMR
jgi:BirA family biotin operon repressor/biotin-[acetyl-CoA-carboxylase] ligase